MAEHGVADDRIKQELASHRFFRSLPEELRDRLAGCGEFVSFDKETEILTEGAPANSFFAIRSGRVAIGVHTPNRGLVTIETLHSGDIAGWSWLFPPYRCHLDAVALEPVEAIELHAQCIRSYVDEDPKAGLLLVNAIAAVMEERLESARMRLVDLYGGDDESTR